MAYDPTTWNHEDVITSQKLNKIEKGLTDVTESAIFGFGGAQQSSDGLTPLSYLNAGDPMPSNPKKGDTVFIKDGNDFTIYSYDGEQWNIKIDPNLSQRLSDTLKEAKDSTDKAIADNNDQINNTIGEVAQEKVDLAIKDSDFNAQAQAMADKALQDAKDNTATVAQETLDSANDNIAQAKSDITDAYKDADGVISKKVDDTATSIGNTISQNKIDSDGKISTAQSTATQALNEVTTKVSQTDYNAKTGDLDNRVTKAQTTADGAVTTVGNYKTSNDARVKATETSIAQNAKDITLRATTTDLNSAKSDYNAQIAQVKVDAGKVETTVSNLSDKVNGLGQINQLFNTEWSPDFAGWSSTGNGNTGAVDKYVTLSGSYSGSNAIYIDNTAETSTYYTRHSQAFPVNGVTSISLSWSVNTVALKNYAHLFVKFIDSTGKSTNNMYSWDSTIGGGWTTKTLPNVSVPSGTVQLVIDFETREGSQMYLSQPMVVFSQTVGDYVQGNYNNNAKIASQQVTIDGITDTVSKQGTSINSVTQRVTTAEGTLTTATDNISGLQTKQTTTANQVTQEIADRKTGDNNTLQSSKDFTTSSITSYDKGVQTQLTQTASGILAQVEATNMVVNSEFDPLNGTWYQLVGSGAVNSTVGTAWSPTTTPSFSDWAVVDGSTLLTYAVGTWFTTALAPAGAGRAYSASIVAGRPTAPSTSTALDLRIGFWDANKKLISNASSGNIIDGTAYKGIDKYKVENKVAPANTKYVSVIIAHSSASATDIIGRPMLNNGTTVSPYVATFGNTSSSTVLSLFKDNWSIGINDNIGGIVSGIVGSASQMSLISKKVVIDSPSTQITGTAWINSAMIQNGSIVNADIADATITNAKIATLDVAKITGDVSSFIQSNWNGTYGSTTITSSGMEVKTTSADAIFDANGVTIYTAKGATALRDGGIGYLTSSNEDIGMVGTVKWAPHPNVDYLMIGLHGYHTTTPGDDNYDVISGKNNVVFGGDGIGFGISNANGGYDMLMTWDSPLVAGYQNRISGWHVEDVFSTELMMYANAGIKISSSYSGGTRTLHTQGVDISSSSKWFGWMSGDNTAGFGTDNTQDVIFFMKGKPYSLYTMLGKLGMR